MTRETPPGAAGKAATILAAIAAHRSDDAAADLTGRIGFAADGAVVGLWFVPRGAPDPGTGAAGGEDQGPDPGR